MQKVTKIRQCPFCKHTYITVDEVLSNEEIIPSSYCDSKEFTMKLSSYRELTCYKDKPEGMKSYVVGESPFKLFYMSEYSRLMACPKCGIVSDEEICTTVKVENK